MGLSLSLLEWYVEAIFALPPDLGMIGWIPKLGGAALLVGAILGALRRQRYLLLFLLPLGVAHLFVALAGLFERSIAYPSNDLAVTIPFLLLQLVICTWLVYKSGRLAALFLALFMLTYSWFAGFIAAMALTGDWL